METIEAYCPNCDKIHSLVKTCYGYHEGYLEESFIFRLYGEFPHGRYYGSRMCYSWGICDCQYGHYVEFSEVPPVCEECKLPRKIYEFDRLMKNFTKQIWREARDIPHVPNATHQCLALTFPQLFRAITAESNAANAAALAPHLPLVLIGIVAEYFGGN
jgi:hypothetical protein